MHVIWVNEITPDTSTGPFTLNRKSTFWEFFVYLSWISLLECWQILVIGFGVLFCKDWIDILSFVRKRYNGQFDSLQTCNWIDTWFQNSSVQENHSQRFGVLIPQWEFRPFVAQGNEHACCCLTPLSLLSLSHSCEKSMGTDVHNYVYRFI